MSSVARFWLASRGIPITVHLTADVTDAQSEIETALATTTTGFIPLRPRPNELVLVRPEDIRSIQIDPVHKRCSPTETQES